MFNSALLALAEAEILDAIHVCPFCGAITNVETGVTLIRIGNERQSLVDSWEFSLTNRAHKQLVEPVLFVVVKAVAPPSRPRE